MKAKMEKKNISSSSSLIRDKKVWKKKTAILGQKDGSKMADQKVVEDKKEDNQKLPSSITMTQSIVDKDVSKLRFWS